MGDLVKRLFQGYDDSDPEYFEGINIALGPFTSGLFRILDGSHTVAQFQAFYNMDASEQVEFQSFVDAVQSEQKLESKILKVMSLGSILNLKEAAGNMTNSGYDTEAEIRAHFAALVA